MDAESTICLSDLVPALRWSRPQQVAEVLADPRMPGGWWSSVALNRAVGMTGVDWLCDRLARLAVGRWDHLPLSDVLPALQVHSVDPALPGWPEPARSVIKGLGGWQRLRRLTASDLQTPAAPATAEVVLTAVFREIINHLQDKRPVTSGAIPQQSAAQASPQATAHTAVQPTPTSTARPAAARAPQAPATGPHPAIPAATGSQPQPGEPARPAPSHAAPARPSHLDPLGTAAPESRPDAPHPAGPPRVPLGAPPAAAPTPPPTISVAGDHPMVGLVDGLFREWDPLARAVAVQRLFAAEPVSLRALAHSLNVDRELLSQAQRTAEERVLMWLRSPDSAALTGHLFGLTEWLGAAATQEQLIGADPSHPIEVPALGTPLWRVLVTLMPDRRLQDDWLVVGDLSGLREKTRRLLATRTPDTDVVELLGKLGIRSHSAKAWLDSMPQDERPDTPAPEFDNTTGPLPRRTPGANGHQHRGGVPVPSQANNGPDAATALAALNALTGGGTPKPHLVPSPRSTSTSTPSSDPRRWQRIDVTSGHLRGEPVAVPEGYAAQLGMRPGTLLSVTGPGDNAVVLVWRDRQPAFDSLQPVLMRLNARPGDSVYVTVDGYRLDCQLTS